MVCVSYPDHKIRPFDVWRQGDIGMSMLIFSDAACASISLCCGIAVPEAAVGLTLGTWRFSRCSTKCSDGARGRLMADRLVLAPEVPRICSSVRTKLPSGSPWRTDA